MAFEADTKLVMFAAFVEMVDDGAAYAVSMAELRGGGVGLPGLKTAVSRP